MGLPLLRVRSDEQLVALFRDGYDDAFRAMHDRYHKRLLAYMRQMLPRRQDAEDALQEVFVRAYFGLRAHDRELSLRAWLFRVAHNRCIDELRRPTPPPPEIIDMVRPAVQDTAAQVDCRESLRRLIADVRRLPDQQRSALLMRELGGMSYADLAQSLGVSVPAVKSLLVRARVGLARAAEARDTACSDIREALVGAHDDGVRPNAMARRHMRDCSGCRSFRRELRGMSRELAALAPTLGPLGLLAKLLGGSSGAGGGTAAAGGAVGAGGTASSAGVVVGANHVAALLAAAVATGGAVAIQHTIASPLHPAPTHPARVAARASAGASGAAVVVYAPNGASVTVPATQATQAASPNPPASQATSASPRHASAASGLASAVSTGSTSAAQTVDSSPDNTLAGGSTQTSPPPAGTRSSTSSASGSSTGTSLLPTGTGATTALGSSSSQPTGSTATGSGSTSSGSTGSGSTASTTSSGTTSSGSGTSGSDPTAGTSSAGSTSGSSSTSGSGTSSGTSSSGTGSQTTSK